LPSLYEGLGAALVEAMALCVPIAASDLPAVREVTSDGEAALLVAPGEPEKLFGALDRLIDDPLLAARLAVRGRALYLKNFTPERATRGLIDMYQRVCSSASSTELTKHADS
jgi:glycosyltransferase involved in cell wall biosynthesis